MMESRPKHTMHVFLIVSMIIHVLIEIELVSNVYILGIAIIKFTAFTAVLLKKIMLI